MYILATPGCQHLLPGENDAIFTQFPDGQWCVQVKADLGGKEVTIMASLYSADSFLQLLLLIDAVERLQPKNIHLFIPYFGYGRDDFYQKGFSIGAQVIARALQSYNFFSKTIMHPHNVELAHKFGFQSFLPIHFFTSLNLQAIDCIIVAPDEGAANLARAIGNYAQKEVLILHKERFGLTVLHKKIHNALVGKNVLIVDDVIATGNTVASAATLLKENGAASISVAATHGVLCGQSWQILEKAPIEKIIITNSLQQTITCERLIVVDCAPIIASFLHY